MLLRAAASKAAASAARASRRHASAATAAPALKSGLAAAPVLSQEDLATYHRDGFLVCRNLFSAAEKKRIYEHVAEVQQWPFCPGKHMHYFEKVPAEFRQSSAGQEEGEFMLCRTENYLDFHPGLWGLLGDGSRAARAAAELLGDPRGTCVFKERINYKLPGGGGFAAHQDAPAWSGDDPTAADAELSFIQHSLNMNVAVDPMYLANGGLEVVVGGHATRQIAPQNADGTLTREFCDAQQWTEVRLEPGDTLFFSLHIPHRSGRNLTAGPRRAVYVTYAGASHTHPEERRKYYETYRRQFPPAGEREEDLDYDKGDRVYNWATPISREQPQSWGPAASAP